MSCAAQAPSRWSADGSCNVKRPVDVIAGMTGRSGIPETAVLAPIGAAYWIARFGGDEVVPKIKTAPWRIDPTGSLLAEAI
jgi:hypothetical protein